MIRCSTQLKVKVESPRPTTESPPWPRSLHSDALHGIAGEFVRAVEAHTEADASALLIQFLAMFGCAVGRGPRYPVGADQHRLNLNLVLVGATSSGRKGTSLAFVRHIFKTADEAFATSRIQSGLSSGEGLIWAVRDPVKKQVPIRRSGQIEGYQEEIVDEGVNDKRLLVTESEFARVLRVANREGNTLSALIRIAWDGEKLQTLTKNEPATATDPHIAVIGHITAGELKRNLDEVEIVNGLANRFLWVCTKRSKLLPDGGELPEEELDELARDVKRSLMHARRIGSVRMDDRAKCHWHTVYEQLTADIPGMRGALLARGAPIVLRLALIYAMLDQRSEIQFEHLRAALAVWRYSEQSVAHIFGDSTGDRAADRIIAALRSKPEGLSRTELATAFKSDANRGKIGPALELLRSAGMAVNERVSTKGRDKEIWRSA